MFRYLETTYVRSNEELVKFRETLGPLYTVMMTVTIVV